MAHILFEVSNLIIAAGYLLGVPTLVLPHLPLTGPVRIAGTLFFALCGITHLGLAFQLHTTTPDSGPSEAFWAAEHAVQAAATWGFVLGFRNLLRKAKRD